MYLKQCGTPGEGPSGLETLYSHPCRLDLPPETIHQLAAQIRADPAALGQLREHLNRLDTGNSRIENLEPLYRSALAEMEKAAR